LDIHEGTSYPLSVNTTDIIKGNNNTTEVGRDVNNLTTTANEKEKCTLRLNVTAIAMKYPRKDRLGSNIKGHSFSLHILTVWDTIFA